MRDEYIVSSRAFGKSSRELKNLINDYLNFRGIDIVVTSFDYDDYIKLKADNEKLRECAEFYAEIDNWDNVNYPNMFIGENDCVEVDHPSGCAGGNIARQTLKEIGGSDE